MCRCVGRVPWILLFLCWTGPLGALTYAGRENQSAGRAKAWPSCTLALADAEPWRLPAAAAAGDPPRPSVGAWQRALPPPCPLSGSPEMLRMGSWQLVLTPLARTSGPAPKFSFTLQYLIINNSGMETGLQP